MTESSIFAGLEPRSVFEHFHGLSQIPRLSGNQKGISDYIVSLIRGFGLECRQDDALNVIARKPASAGYEDAPPIMIQAHMDMVGEKKPGIEHDFARDAIKMTLQGDMVRARGTTLGADDGMGMAFILALLADPDAVHPELEAVFTTDEETTMNGAFSLDYSQIKSRRIISLDAEAVFVSGSGKLEVEMTLPKETVPLAPGFMLTAIEISGLRGGHSGKNAMDGRANAVVLLNRTLLALDRRLQEYQLINISGGAGMSSAFAREARAVIALAPDKIGVLEKVVAEQLAVYQVELDGRDPELRMKLAPCAEQAVEAFSNETTLRLKRLLAVLPDGVFTINHDFPGTMESCSNTGVVETLPSAIFVTTVIRGFSGSMRYYLREKISIICELLGMEYKFGRDQPHWEYNVPDAAVAALKRVYPDKKHKTGQGTCEAGIFRHNLPGAVVIGLGAPFYDAHSPDEHFFVSEVQQYWKRFLEFIALPEEVWE